MDDKRECPKCGYKLRGRKPSPKPPREEAKPTESEPTPTMPKITINITVDCSNPASIEAFMKLLKELNT
jgi:hypothetical protein